MTRYYRRFFQSYGKIAQPLTSLCKGTGVLRWTEEADRAFKQLKEAMTTAPMLTLPDFSKNFIIDTDASGSGISTVLMQKGHPIAFISKALSVKH